MNCDCLSSEGTAEIATNKTRNQALAAAAAARGPWPATTTHALLIVLLFYKFYC